MVAIYVKKEWLSTIGETASLVFVREETTDTVSLLAGRVKVDYPFLDCELVHTNPAPDTETFLPSKIPVSVVCGIFDLTSKQVSKYGFTPPV